MQHGKVETPDSADPLPVWAVVLRFYHEESGGKTQRAAEAAGVTRRAVQFYLRGQKKPRKRVARKLARALGIPWETWRKKLYGEEDG